MGTIVKVQRNAGASFKVIIRQRGLSPITKTFKSKSAARAWMKRVEADDEQCKARGNRKAAGVTVPYRCESVRTRYDHEVRNRCFYPHRRWRIMNDWCVPRTLIADTASMRCCVIDPSQRKRSSNPHSPAR